MRTIGRAGSNALGIEVRLLPAAYVRAYVKRNKTDAADACALLEAARCAEIAPGAGQVDRAAGVAGAAPHPIAVDGHPHFAHQRTARLLPRVRDRHAQGARLGVEQIGRVLADPRSAVPELIRQTMKLLVEEIRLLEGSV